MSLSDIPAQQIQLIADNLASNPELAKQFNALMGITPTEKEEPAPAVSSLPSASVTNRITTATGRNAGKPSRPEQGLEQQDSVEKKDPAAASDILSLVADVTLPRRITFTANTFVPNTTALFYTLYLMDNLIGKTFRARRTHALMNPIAHCLYFSILVSIQVARCMKFSNVLDNPEDLSFLEVFLDMFPPEKLAIPGPLLPFFKAICTYKPQNELYARVSPAFPTNSYRSNADDLHVTHQNASIIFPNVPVVTTIYNSFRTAVQGSNDGAFFSGNMHWPFTLADAAAPNGNYTAAVDIGGYSFPANRTWREAATNSLTTPPLRYRPRFPRDLYTNIHDNIDDWHAAPTPPRLMNSLRHWCSMERMTWFRSFLAPMAAYSSLWIGSGSLADCSVDGPAPGSYICRYQTSDTAPSYTHPMPFLTTLQFSLSTRMYTTQGTPEPVTEKLAVFSQIHARLATDHPYHASLTPAYDRSGPVWDARPIYGPSSQDYTYESMTETIRRFVQPHLLK
jgi:hypothetical protein